MYNMYRLMHGQRGGMGYTQGRLLYHMRAKPEGGIVNGRGDILYRQVPPMH